MWTDRNKENKHGSGSEVFDRGTRTLSCIGRSLLTLELSIQIHTNKNPKKKSEVATRMDPRSMEEVMAHSEGSQYVIIVMADSGGRE